MDRLAVLLGDRLAGTITRERGGRLRLEYAEDYRAAPDATPLSCAMPLAVTAHGNATVTPWLWGLLPENPDVLARWGRRFQVSAASPFRLLGTPIGEDCAGAVRFCPEDDVDRLLVRPGSVELLDDTGVEERIRDLRRDTTAWLGRDFTGQFSLAGAQAKTALHFDGTRWGVPRGATPTTHILKPAIRGFDDHELNEHLCLAAARLAGLPAVRTSVRAFGAESVVVVERYDRFAADGGIRRVHQEDALQALALPPERKYEAEGGPGAADVIALLRREMPAAVAVRAVAAFVDALAWNWVIAGTDAHAKNYSLLLAGRQVRLAPFYDIASALPYGTHERRLRMAMRIGGDYGLFYLWDRWAKSAAGWGIEPEALHARVRELAATAPDAFATAAADPAVAGLGRTGPARLVDAVASRAGRCVSQVA